MTIGLFDATTSQTKLGSAGSPRRNRHRHETVDGGNVHLGAQARLRDRKRHRDLDVGARTHQMLIGQNPDLQEKVA